MSLSPDPYLSPLIELGIEEIEPMTCEDTLENRRKLRAAKLTWTGLVDHESGLPTGLIRAFTEAELTARRDSVWDAKRPIMEDPENAYSDYVGPEDLPMDADLPWWVKQHLRTWMEDEIAHKPEDKRRPFPIRCEVIRTDGTRCWAWAGNPKKSKRCKKHMPWEMDADSANAKIAKIKMLQAAPAMADGLEELALNANESGAVRLKAMTEILDRAGVRGGTEIDISGGIEVTDTGAEVKDRLERMRSRVIASAARAAAAEDALKELETPTDVVEAVIVPEEREPVREPEE